MIWLLLAVLMSASISMIMRTAQKNGAPGIGLVVCNYIGCVLLGLTGTLRSGTGALEGLSFTMGLGALTGALFLLSFLLLNLNVEKNGVVVSSTFMRLGLVVSLLLSLLLFHEVPHAWQVAGILIAIFAILLLNEKGGARKLGPLLLLMASAGLSDSMPKVFEAKGAAAAQPLFLTVVFGSALVIGGIVIFLKGERVCVRHLLFGLLLSLPNYFSSRFFMKALMEVPSAVAFPVYSAGAIMVVTLLGRVLFQERLGRRQQVAMVLFALSLVLLNL